MVVQGARSALDKGRQRGVCERKGMDLKWTPGLFMKLGGLRRVGRGLAGIEDRLVCVAHGKENMNYRPSVEG